MRFKVWLENTEYPTLRWVKHALRWSLHAPMRPNVLDAYIVGSEAKGMARPDSDLDIAVVIPPIRGKTATQVSEFYHSKFPSDQSKPHWGHRRVDFQFFYPNDPELERYQKIRLI